MQQVGDLARREAFPKHRCRVAEQVGLRGVGEQQARDLVDRQREHFLRDQHEVPQACRAALMAIVSALLVAVHPFVGTGKGAPDQRLLTDFAPYLSMPEPP